jgi:hypothetical protein
MFIEILPLALGSAIYPTLLALVVLIIGRPNPRRLLLGFLCGALTTSLAIGCAIVFGLTSSNAVGGSDHTVGPGVNFVVAGLMLLLLWILATDRDRGLRERRARKKEARAGDDRDPLSQRLLARDSVWIAFVVGMALNLPGALYLVALKDIAAADLPTSQAVLYIVLYNLIMFQWAEIPLIGYAIAPERTEAAVKSFNDWIGAHTRKIAMTLCVAAAGYLIARGLAAVL